MFSDSDYKRAKLLDYWVIKCTNGEISEEEMENEHYKLADMEPHEIAREYKRLIKK